MITKEWPAQEYALGSYIQSTVAESYLNDLTIQATDDVLDIGCGDGRFSLKIIERFPMQSFMGIDASDNMLVLAHETIGHYSHVRLKKQDVLSMPFNNMFDYIISFWCLQWTENIQLAFSKIYQALRDRGRLFIMLPTGDDPFMTTYETVKESGQFPVLQHFKAPVDYTQLNTLEEKLNAMPFKQLSIQKHHRRLLLPSLDIFHKFLSGLAFFKGQVSEDEIKQINEAMVDAYQKDCNKKYAGDYCFEFTNLCVVGQK